MIDEDEVRPIVLSSKVQSHVAKDRHTYRCSSLVWRSFTILYPRSATVCQLEAERDRLGGNDIKHQDKDHYFVWHIWIDVQRDRCTVAIETNQCKVVVVVLWPYLESVPLSVISLIKQFDIFNQELTND